MVITSDKGASSEIIKDGYGLTLNDIEKWLINKGIISHDQKLLRFQDTLEWQRGGAETYISSFEIQFSKNSRVTKKEIILKAIVTLTPEKTLKNWELRRALLAFNNVPVSNWYNASDGLIIEDKYLPFILDASKFHDLLKIAFQLDNLCFSTLSFTSALMLTQNSDLIFVDFGFDLGQIGMTKSTTAIDHIKQLFPQNVQEIESYINNIK